MERPVCPVCKKSRDLFEKPEKWLPFCSSRCKQVDLGKWFFGQYEISRPLEPEDFADPSQLEKND